MHLFNDQRISKEDRNYNCKETNSHGCEKYCSSQNWYDSQFVQSTVRMRDLIALCDHVFLSQYLRYTLALADEVPASELVPQVLNWHYMRCALQEHSTIFGGVANIQRSLRL